MYRSKVHSRAACHQTTGCCCRAENRGGNSLVVAAQATELACRTSAHTPTPASRAAGSVAKSIRMLLFPSYGNGGVCVCVVAHCFASQTILTPQQGVWYRRRARTRPFPLSTTHHSCPNVNHSPRSTLPRRSPAGTPFERRSFKGKRGPLTGAVHTRAAPTTP